MHSGDASTQQFSSPFPPTKQVAVIRPSQLGGKCHLTEHSGDFERLRIIPSFFYLFFIFFTTPRQIFLSVWFCAWCKWPETSRAAASAHPAPHLLHLFTRQGVGRKGFSFHQLQENISSLSKARKSKEGGVFSWPPNAPCFC